MTARDAHPRRVKSRHPVARNSPDSVDRASYEIRIKGELHNEALASFAEFAASTRAPETILSGAIPDLFGLLRRLQSLGLELIEVRRLSEPSDSSRVERSPVEGDLLTSVSTDYGVTLRLVERS
jgi:hypothetical protein